MLHRSVAQRSGEMTGNSTTADLPARRCGAPKDRHPGPVLDLGLPAGTEVFSADNHISLADDIFFERFPDSLKDRAREMLVGRRIGDRHGRENRSWCPTSARC